MVNFSGTDTVAALSTIARFYDMPCAGHSIPAAEHSTITSWTQSGEADAFKNMLTQFPTGLVAVVSDSYNIWLVLQSHFYRVDVCVGKHVALSGVISSKS